VPEIGYRWVGTHPIPPVDKRRHPFLTLGRIPGDRPVRARRYHPLKEHTGLFRVFAEMEPAREAIRAFAERFGSLGGNLTTSIVLYDQPAGTGYAVGSGEALQDWAREIMELRWADRLLEAARRGDEEGLRQVIVWEEDGSGVKFITHPDLEPAEWMRLKTPGRVWWIAREGDGILEKLRPGDLVQPALHHVQQVANKQLRGRVSPRLLWDEERGRLNLYLVPEGLVGALWLQFAGAVERDTDFRRCSECGLWFELAPGTARSDKLFCSNGCRTKAYRRRRTEAVRLHGEGRQINDIARALESDPETVRGWIEKARRTPGSGQVGAG
jgi:hypothetical protein